MEFDYLEHYKIDAEQFDYFDEQSGATAHSERRLREYIISEIPKETNSILDVGSGSAWLAKQFQSSGVFICSLDATIVNTSKALEKYPSPNHVAVVADAFALPFKKESFDCVVAAEIIEHVSDPSAFVHSLMKVVKPGGMLIISTPYKEVIRYALCIHCNQKTPLNAHLHSFDEHTLRSFFNHESIKHFTWRAFNNKLLLFARSYIVLRYFSFSFWRIIDRLANMIYKKPVNIVITVMKE
jgi:2-polyprenyl-3-methyl-5-hydroxy-6-metoxy-1,4-benzoquinol methylase